MINQRRNNMKSLNARDLKPGDKIIFKVNTFSLFIPINELCEVIATDKDKVVFGTKMIQITLNFKTLSECHFIYAKDFL